MGKKVRIQLASEDRDRLEAVIANGNPSQKHVRRTGIVLLAGDNIGPDKIQRRSSSRLSGTVFHRHLHI